MRRDRRKPCRAGFTLLEVIVALAVSAVVVLGARMLAEQVGEAGRYVVAAATRADRDANGERMLRDLLLRLEVGTSGAANFAGAADSAAFSSWCDVPRGWRERCNVSLVVHRGEARDTLRVRTSSGLDFAALDRPSPVSLRYLDDAGAGGRWFISWGAGITAPLAIGVVTPADTAILRIGERG
ncbi:MAG TPA: prepilin-type N-terminal cleavage/methylation domain-containing protein [Gemmatimonadaceae bacterium]|nr:prepilin-type N-terminal cleavage/methylation domain-containing protein [Gemmatimonadaceae bacterium]